MKFLTISQETIINKAEEKEMEIPQTTKIEMSCESKQQFCMYHDHQQQHILAVTKCQYIPTEFFGS
jgi:hypothetical protein